jgi:phospholipase C
MSLNSVCRASEVLSSCAKCCLLVLMLVAVPGFAWGSGSLVSITVTPANPILPVGVSVQMLATGTFSDGTKQDITTSVTWSSSSSSVASVSSNGVMTTNAAGLATVKAVQGTSSGSTSLTVKTLSSLSMSPANQALPLNSSTQYSVIGKFSDKTTESLTNYVTWSSSVTSVATVSNSTGSQGFVTCVGTGTTIITAHAGSVTGSTNLTVKNLQSIIVFSPAPWIPVGGETNLSAIAKYTDGTSQNVTSAVQWSSSASSVLTVGNSAGTYGLASGVAKGTATIRATVGSITGSSTIAVKIPSSIAVTPANPVRGNGMQTQFSALATYTDHTTQVITNFVAWSSDTPGVASINPQGLALAVAAGQANIGAQVGGAKGSTVMTVKTFSSLAVTPSNATLAGNAQPPLNQQSFTATASYTDGTQQDVTNLAAWSTSSPQVASVSNGLANEGVATALSVGSTTITAHAGPESATAGVSVTSTGLGNIRHIIFMLQENRSLDTYLGLLGQYAQVQKQFSGYNFDGLPLSTLSAETYCLSHVCPVSLPGKTGDMVQPYPLQTVCHENDAASWGPSEFDVDGGKMDKFLIDEIPSTIDLDGARAIGYYDWNDLPYYYELFFQFATSDRYFSSVLGPTTPNRQYMFTATSSGNISDAISVPPGGFTTPTIFDALDRAGISWRMYYQDTSHRFIGEYSTYGRDSSKVVPIFTSTDPIGRWKADLQNESTLPQVIFIERGQGTDEHPGANIQVGANRVSGIINALLASPTSTWESSVFVLAFDEGGGRYDHVVPPAAPAPDNIPPQLVAGSEPSGFMHTGFRVPMVVISPWVRPHFVSHLVSPIAREHTSILKLIETRFNVPSLTIRDASADNMTEFFDFSAPNLLMPPSLPAQPTNGECFIQLETKR